MNNQRSIRTGMGRSVATAALVLGALWSAPAYAVAPANTTVTNTATLTYTGDATGIQASVDFKVTLKASPPSLGSGPIAGGGVALSLTGPGDNTVVAGQASSATYIITANANAAGEVSFALSRDGGDWRTNFINNLKSRFLHLTRLGSDTSDLNLERITEVSWLDKIREQSIGF